ncbi:hypothetical protein SAMN07250955_101549 [Arboricoccus pini]|uniref:Uncharacterized protein n=1 Tax=Arboricoccus pini TaxID=1963835 RepID=A0A212QC10_9PROT|nr:hypothetical protein [Arboricoccus pini]SNB56774.1 hypothetical protein SAMN07250955_101549 [Arboricoccus pini]
MISSLPIKAIMAASSQFEFLASVRLPNPRAVISEAARLVAIEGLPGRLAWLRAAASQVASLPGDNNQQALQVALDLLAQLMLADGQISASEHGSIKVNARPMPGPATMIAA